MPEANEYSTSTFAIIDKNAEWRNVRNAVTDDRIDIAESLPLPAGKHLVRLTISVEVLSSEVAKPKPSDSQSDWDLTFKLASPLKSLDGSSLPITAAS